MSIGSKSLRRFSLLFLCVLGGIALIPARQPSAEAAPLPVEATAAKGPPYLYDISMISATDGWIVASHSTTYHWNGAYWHRLPPIPGVAELYSLSVVNAKDVWAAGHEQSAVIVRWNGSSWQHMPTPELKPWTYTTISMLSPTEGWVGAISSVIRWNGTGWEDDRRVLGAHASAALSPTDVWMADEYDHLQHYNGTDWIIQDTKKVIPHDIAFLSPQEGWIVGRENIFCQDEYCLYQGASAYWNGTSWTYIGLPTIIDSLNAVHASREAGTWAVGSNDNQSLIFRWTGSAWESLPVPADVGPLTDISMVSPTFGWAIGYNGELLYWNGIEWQVWAANIRKVHIPMTAGG